MHEAGGGATGTQTTARVSSRGRQCDLCIPGVLACHWAVPSAGRGALSLPVSQQEMCLSPSTFPQPLWGADAGQHPGTVITAVRITAAGRGGLHSGLYPDAGLVSSIAALLEFLSGISVHYCLSVRGPRVKPQVPSAPGLCSLVPFGRAASGQGLAEPGVQVLLCHSAAL